MTVLTHQFAVAQTAYPGFSLDQAGDRYLIAPFDEGLLIAAIDGLGHGPKAAEAAIAAVDALRQDPAQPVTWLLQRCDRALHGTRGAAVSLISVSYSEQQFEWAGVGNVAAVILRDSAEDGRHEALLSRPGVVGFRMPHIRVVRLGINPYDTLILTTDGIHSGYLKDAPLQQPSQELADHILTQHARGTDDALVVVVRLLA